MAAWPRIGVSMDTGRPDENRKLYELNADYPNAIFRAGGLPVLLPHTDRPEQIQAMVESLDGLLIPGGNDCDPSLYGQSKHPSTKLMDPLRQTFDLALLKLAEERRLPTLGICLGFQLMNVHRGGTLHQSVAEAMPTSPIRHSKPGDHTNFHDVVLRPGSALAAILQGERMAANSRHRQGVAALGQGLVATAHAPDGLVEGIEDPAYPFWQAVQWHPENLIDTPHQRLFSALVQAARAYAALGKE